MAVLWITAIFYLGSFDNPFDPFSVRILQAVNLQLEDVVVGVERFKTAGKPHGAEVPEEHD